MARFQCYRTKTRGVQWRLLGGNNRVLGIGQRDYEDYDAAVREIELLREYVPDASFDVEHAGAGLWWWHLTKHLGCDARSAQGFARRVDAELAAERFRARVPAAEIDPVLAVFQPGRRGRYPARTNEPRSDVSTQRPVN